MKFSVLLIDRSLNQMNEIKEIFSQSDIVDCLYEATSGVQGLEILKNKPIDLIICNPALSDMDGLQFLNVLQTIPNHPRPPVLLISSDAQIENKAKVFELGAQDFLRRPGLGPPT